MLELIITSATLIAGTLAIGALWASKKAKSVYLKMMFFAAMWVVLGAYVYVGVQITKLP